MIDDEDDKDSSQYLVFKCISHLFLSYFQRVRRQSPPSANTISFPPQVQILNRQIWDWCHLRLYQVMMIMIIMMIMAMVVTSMLIMEIKMIMMMTMIRNTSGNVWLNWLCWQQISNIVFPRILLWGFDFPLLDQVIMIMRGWWMMITLLCTVRVRLFVCQSVLCVCVCICLFCV